MVAMIWGRSPPAADRCPEARAALQPPTSPSRSFCGRVRGSRRASTGSVPFPAASGPEVTRAAILSAPIPPCTSTRASPPAPAPRWQGIPRRLRDTGTHAAHRPGTRGSGLSRQPSRRRRRRRRIGRARTSPAPPGLAAAPKRGLVGHIHHRGQVLELVRGGENFQMMQPVPGFADEDALEPAQRLLRGLGPVLVQGLDPAPGDPGQEIGVVLDRRHRQGMLHAINSLRRGHPPDPVQGHRDKRGGARGDGPFGHGCREFLPRRREAPARNADPGQQPAAKA